MVEQTANTPSKPPRSPVERAVVWGVIGIGLFVILMEGQSYYAHASVLKSLRAKLQEVGEAEGDAGMTQADVDAILKGKKPDESTPLTVGTTAMGAARLDIYNYKGLVRTRQLYVYYGIEGKQAQPPEVMEVSTGPSETLDEAMAKLPPVTAPAEGAGGPPGPGMNSPPGGPGAGGPGAGGPGAGGEGPAAPGRRGRGGAGRPAVEGDEKAADETSKTEEKKTEEKPEEKKTDASADDAAKPEPKKADQDTKPEETKSEETKKE